MKDLSGTIGSILNYFTPYGFWGLLAALFLMFGMKHVAPIIKAIGGWRTEDKKIELSHKRSMIKLQNKYDQDLVGKQKDK